MANVSSNTTITTQSTQQASSATPGQATPTSVSQAFSCNLVNGTAADSADLNHVLTYTLSGSATTIDLSSLTDRYGNAVNFARVRRLTIKNRSTTNGQILTVSGGSSNPWAAAWGATGSVIVHPSTVNNASALVLLAPNTTGYAVSGTSKTIKLDPGANTFQVDVEIEGASA